MKNKILLVDPDLNNLTVYGRKLVELGYEVSGVFSATEALTEIQAKPFDLVITDNRVGNMSGVGLATKIKRAKPETLVVLITPNVPKALPSCLDGAIQKPPKGEDFVRLGELFKKPVVLTTGDS